MIHWPKRNDYIDIHSHHTEIEEGVFRIYNQLITNQEDQVYSGPHSVGLHPWNIKDFKHLSRLDQILEKHISEDSCLFVGECGLDKYIITSIDQQTEVFSLHIQHSEKTSKPLIIHCVKAHQELFTLKKNLKPMQTWIIHGFNSGPQLASDLIDKGISLSIGDYLFRNEVKASEVLKRIPLSNLFLETDESEVSIQQIYDKVAIHYQVNIKELKATILDNFTKLV